MVEISFSDGTRRSFLRIEVVSIIALELAKWTVSVAILLEFFGIIQVVQFLESGGGTLCHHQACRCFSDFDEPWAVCARCSGMYFGWIVSQALSPILKSRICNSRSLHIVTGLFLFAVVSALLERSGVFTTTNVVRSILGMPLGVFPAVLILFAMEHLKEATRITSRQS